MQMKGRQQEPGVPAVETLAMGAVADTVAAMATGKFAQAIAAVQPGVCQMGDGDAQMASQVPACSLVLDHRSNLSDFHRWCKSPSPQSEAGSQARPWRSCRGCAGCARTVRWIWLVQLAASNSANLPDYFLPSHALLSPPRSPGLRSRPTPWPFPRRPG